MAKHKRRFVVGCGPTESSLIAGEGRASIRPVDLNDAEIIKQLLPYPKVAVIYELRVWRPRKGCK